MQATGSIDRRVISYRARFTLIEVLIELLVAGWRILSGWVEAIAENRRSAQACRNLHDLSDHYLKDIGIRRSDISRMFR